MVGQYRIITDGMCFEVQRKGWLFWRHCSPRPCTGMPSFGHPFTYFSEHDAKNAMADMMAYERKIHPWRVVDAD